MKRLRKTNISHPQNPNIGVEEEVTTIATGVLGHNGDRTTKIFNLNLDTNLTTSLHFRVIRSRKTSTKENIVANAQDKEAKTIERLGYAIDFCISELLYFLYGAYKLLQPKRRYTLK